MSGTTHVTLGSSAAGSLMKGLATRDVLWLADVLSCGPLSDFTDCDSWLAQRLAFWNAVIQDCDGPSLHSHAEGELCTERDRLLAADELIVWVGSGLSDQLMLVWMPRFLEAIGGEPSRIRLVQIERNHDGDLVPNLGMLNPAEYGSAPAPRRLSEAELAYLDDAWRAATAADPQPLLRLIDHPGMPLPLVRDAFRRFLGRYPDVHSGVNRYETLLLRHTRDHGPMSAGVIGNVLMESHDDQDPTGDVWLFWRLQRLANPALPHPALAMSGKTMRGTEVRLTPVGERVLNGDANFVELNGIDDWVGGVHLDSKSGNVWFHHEDTLVRAQA